MSHPIESIMKITMEEISQMVDVNTIVGNPILTTAQNMVLPVSKVSLGFLSGGGEYSQRSSPVKRSGEAVENKEEKFPFAGVSAAGMCLTPMAFLSVNNDTVKVFPATYKGTIDRLIELLPYSVSEIERIVKDSFSHKQHANHNQGGSNATIITSPEE